MTSVFDNVKGESIVFLWFYKTITTRVHDMAILLFFGGYVFGPLRFIFVCTQSQPYFSCWVSWDIDSLHSKTCIEMEGICGCLVYILFLSIIAF